MYGNSCLLMQTANLNYAHNKNYFYKVISRVSPVLSQAYHWSWWFFFCAYFLSYSDHLHHNSNPRKIFMAVAFVPIISLPKQKKIGFGAGLLSCLVSKLQKTFSPGLKPRTFFKVLTSLCVISSK